MNWIPTQIPGHTYLRANRAALRRGRRQEQLEMEVVDKVRKIY